jgi:hypothetical protein
VSRERQPEDSGDKRSRRKKAIKKARGGPSRQPARKPPERRRIVAAKRSDVGGSEKGTAKRSAGGGYGRFARRFDRFGNRALERAHPPLRRAGRVVRPVVAPVLAFLALWGRRAVAWLLRALGLLDRGARTAARLAVRGATWLSAVVTPRRAAAAAIVAAAAALVVSQFLVYRGVEVGGPAYAGLPDVAKPPAVAVRKAGEAHSYLLIPLAAIAAAIGVLAGRERARARLGLPVAALGLVALAVVLLVDRPAGLDAGAQTSRFAGASAVLDQGFYAELAAAAGMAIAGVLYYARPCRIRISSSGRAASARRRRPPRQDSSPGRVARSA